MSEIEGLDLQLINLKDDEATFAGTKAIRYLVRRLHEAHDNPALSTMVWALLQDQMKMSVIDDAVYHATKPRDGDQGRK